MTHSLCILVVFSQFPCLHVDCNPATLLLLVVVDVVYQSKIASLVFLKIWVANTVTCCFLTEDSYIIGKEEDGRFHSYFNCIGFLSGNREKRKKVSVHSVSQGLHKLQLLGNFPSILSMPRRPILKNGTWNLARGIPVSEEINIQRLVTERLIRKRHLIWDSKKSRQKKQWGFVLFLKRTLYCELFPCLNSTNYKVIVPSLILLQGYVLMGISSFFLYVFIRDVADFEHCICGDLWLVFAGQHRVNIGDV